MAEKNDILEKLNKATKVANDVSKTITVANQSVNAYQRRKDAKESGALDRLRKETDRFNEKGRKVIISCLVIWCFLIIATVVLCVTKNDVVLRILNL